MQVIETDYLIVGAGAAGMAFADSLIAECDVDVVMVERRHCRGGHWNDAYPFVRIHHASAVMDPQLSISTICISGGSAIPSEFATSINARSKRPRAAAVVDLS